MFAVRPDEQGSLRAALNQLAEQDPLIDVRQDDHRHEIAVSLYGEVQKEVIQATLERDYGIAADFRETTDAVHRAAGRRRRGRGGHPTRRRRPTSPAAARPYSTNPFMATLGLRIEPAALGSGVEVRVDVEPRLVPLYLFKTAGDVRGPDGGVRPRGAERGPGRLAGDRLPGHDDRLRLRVAGHQRGRLPAADRSSSWRRRSSAPGRGSASRWPSSRWRCRRRPRRACSRALGRLGGRVTGQFSADGLIARLGRAAGRARAALQHQLPGLSMGEGILETRFGGYQPIGENPPTPATLRARARSTATRGSPHWRSAGRRAWPRRGTILG